MKKIFACLILLSVSSFPAFSSTQLECYKKFHGQIEELDTAIISGYVQLFESEEMLLDQYFNPASYYRGPHVPYKASVKNTLVNKRSKMKEALESAIRESEDLSAELSSCLKNSKS